ncbi:glycosyltransferase [Bosea sp. PAMC 26642]|uniref:glycosyltransferase n=1 Tax=Bosea sp. (strain PAMC 26642) TaxID=1792307 RepID=UPI000B05F4F2|nr:glycosyltransferase family 2 protein [Bosea sp. PAMC 26642]
MRGARACAAVVLYKPDHVLLARQADALRGCPFFAFANGYLDAELIEALAPTELRLFSSPENLGLGRGLNAVMEAAAREGFTHVMLLDQDTEPPAGVLETLTERFMALERQGERIAILAPRLVPPEGEFYKPIRYEWRGKPRGNDIAAVDFAPTSGSLVSVAAYAEIGPFRDDFFIAGIDVEWGFRAWDRGWGSYIEIDLTVPHRWGEAVSKEEMGKAQILRHSPIRNYYYVRNVIAAARLRHVPLRWRIKSCASLAAQIGLLALRGPAGSLSSICIGLADGFNSRLGPAPAGID